MRCSGTLAAGKKVHLLLRSAAALFVLVLLTACGSSTTAVHRAPQPYSTYGVPPAAVTYPGLVHAGEGLQPMSTMGKKTATTGVPGEDLGRLLREKMGHGTVREAVPLYQDRRAAVPSEPYVPVVIPPEVERAWVVDHVNRDGDLVAGHWIFFKRESRWYIQTREDLLKLMHRYPVPPVPHK